MGPADIGVFRHGGKQRACAAVMVGTALVAACLFLDFHFDDKSSTGQHFSTQGVGMVDTQTDANEGDAELAAERDKLKKQKAEFKVAVAGVAVVGDTEKKAAKALAQETEQLGKQQKHLRKKTAILDKQKAKMRSEQKKLKRTRKKLMLKQKHLEKREKADADEEDKFLPIANKLVTESKALQEEEEADIHEELALKSAQDALSVEALALAKERGAIAREREMLDREHEWMVHGRDEHEELEKAIQAEADAVRGEESVEEDVELHRIQTKKGNIDAKKSKHLDQAVARAHRATLAAREKVRRIRERVALEHRLQPYKRIEDGVEFAATAAEEDEVEAMGADEQASQAWT